MSDHPRAGIAPRVRPMLLVRKVTPRCGTISRPCHNNLMAAPDGRNNEAALPRQSRGNARPLPPSRDVAAADQPGRDGQARIMSKSSKY